MRDRTAHTRPRLAIAAIAAMAFAGCSSEAGGNATGSEGSSSDLAPVESVEVTAIGGSTSPAVQRVDVANGLVLAADTAVVVIDVRTPAEFAEGHLDRAELIDLSAAEFRDRIAQLDRSATYLVYCRSGNRSGQATAIMGELGFHTVYDLDGGIVAWQAAGAPLVK